MLRSLKVDYTFLNIVDKKICLKDLNQENHLIDMINLI